MGTIKFKTTFSGGLGTLDISVDGGVPHHFIADDEWDVPLLAGAHQYQASGAASPGPGGGIQLDISGDVIVDITPINWGPGIILPEIHNFVITI
jgi:hypothetical protein